MEGTLFVADGDVETQGVMETLLPLRKLDVPITSPSTPLSPKRLGDRALTRNGGHRWLQRLDRPESDVTRLGRCRLHHLASAQIAAQLRRMGLSVRPTAPGGGSDLVINGTVRIAVRAALRTTRQQRVRVGERVYHYRRASWQFNFHRHGRIGKRYCDYFICLPVVAADVVPNLHDALIIPWTARRGKTLGIAQQPYDGRYAKYRDTWEELRRHCETAAPVRYIEALQPYAASYHAPI